MTEPEQKNHEDDVEASRRRFQAVFNSPDSFIGVLAPDGTLLEANQTALEFVDAGPAEVEGQPFWETPWWTHSNDLQDQLKGWIGRAASGEYVRFESTHYSPAGDGVTVDGIIRPVTDEDGEVVSLIVEGRSIDERKRYEERLKAIDEATHRLLTADSMEAVGEIIVEVASDALEQPLTAMWEYDPATDTLVPLAAADAALELDASTASTDEIRALPSGSTEMEIFHSGETTVIEDYQTVASPAHPENPLGTLLVVPLDRYGQLHVGSRSVEGVQEDTLEMIEILARNATGAFERVERERTLHRLHEMTRELLQATTPDQVASLIVEAGEDILGLPYTHVYLLDDDGQRLRPAAVSEEMRDRFDELPTFSAGDGLLWEAIESGTVTLYDDVAEERTKASDLPFRGAVIVPLGNRGVLGSGSLEPAEFDTFDRELASILGAEAEAALEAVERELTVRQREAELARQNERLEEFTSVVSHDLRNPLTVAKGRLELAREDTDSEELDHVAEALDRMNELIEDTLVLARQGQTIDETAVVGLSGIVNEAWDTADVVDASLDLEGDLGTLRGDGDRLRELLENLFRNAVEHGGDQVTVTVGRCNGGFYVADDGRGIPVEDHEEVFDHGYSTRTAGTGLGLAIVKRIAEAHGWDVTVAESANGGARFEFTGVD